jgi:hypothetical protein
MPYAVIRETWDVGLYMLGQRLGVLPELEEFDAQALDVRGQLRVPVEAEGSPPKRCMVDRHFLFVVRASAGVAYLDPSGQSSRRRVSLDLTGTGIHSKPKVCRIWFCT